MINLPSGFNFPALASDLFSFALPFIGIAVLFAAAYYIRRVMRSFR